MSPKVHYQGKCTRVPRLSVVTADKSGGVSSGAAQAINDLQELERGFDLSLRARNLSPRTMKSYVEAVRLFRE